MPCGLSLCFCCFSYPETTFSFRVVISMIKNVLKLRFHLSLFSGHLHPKSGGCATLEPQNGRGGCRKGQQMPLSCRCCAGQVWPGWEQVRGFFLQGYPAAVLEVPNQVTQSGFGFVLTSFCCSLKVKHCKPDRAVWLQAGCGLPAGSFVTMSLHAPDARS